MAPRPIVIFGIGNLAELANYFFTFDSPRTVAAFTVDGERIDTKEAMGLPVVPFEDLENRYPPSDFDLFVAVGYSGLNRVREQRCNSGRARGYELPSYVSSHAVTWPNLSIGENCFVMEGNVVQPFVTLGDGVIMFGSSVVSHHVTIGDWCFVGSEATISGGVKIGPRSFLGVNCTIREYVSVGSDCIVGAGSLILADIPPGSSYVTPGTKDSGIPSRRLSALL